MMEQFPAILKGVMSLCVFAIVGSLVGILVYAMIGSCATSSTVEPVRRGLHSNIADIWLPEGATLDPHSNPYGENKFEMWHAGAPIGLTTQEMNALLPVNQPLDGLPWCGSTTWTGSNSTSTYWAWGTSTDKVSVGVDDFKGKVMITIGHGPPTNGVCQPG